MTDTATQNETTQAPLIPQRATLPDGGEKPALPPLPENDPHDGGEADTAAQRPMESTARSAQGVPVDHHFNEGDPYAGLDDSRPSNFVRQPFGEARLKLQAPARPGFRRYWFNDTPGRVQGALEAGYSFVKLNGRNTRNVVGRAREGGALVAYLMEVPQEWFDKDMAAQQARVDETDAAIKGGRLGATKGEMTKDGDNRYVPKEGITYEPKRA